MLSWTKVMTGYALVLGLMALPAMAHGNHKHVCKKDGKVIKVKGKNADEKKAACEAKGGSWEEEEGDD